MEKFSFPTPVAPAAGKAATVDEPNPTEPAPTAVPEPEPTVNPAVVTKTAYAVQAGDTLRSIAERFGVTIETLMQTNSLSADAILGIGQELQVLSSSGALYVVQEGDTIKKIADAHGVTSEDILAANNITDEGALPVATEIVVPGADAAPRAIVASASRSGERPQPPKPTTYVVQAGDTLANIAHSYGISVETMLWSNGISDPDIIIPGFELMILPVNGYMYEVVEGDTLGNIAASHGVGVDEILMANGIDDPSTLTIGSKLILPGAKPLTPTAAPAPTNTPAPEPTAPAPVEDEDAVEDDAATPEPEPTATPQPAPAAPPEPAPAEPTKAPPVVEDDEDNDEAPAPSSDMGEIIVATALQYVGYDYVWGGISPNPGFDCTGFVYFVTNRTLGLNVPRDLWGQLNAGTRISRANVQRGDLVFFQNTYQPGLSHAGIALSNSTFVHASSETYGVIVSNLNDAYWAPRWYGATRVY